MSKFDLIFQSLRQKYRGKVLTNEIFSILTALKEQQPILIDQTLFRDFLKPNFTGILYQQLQNLIKTNAESIRLKIRNKDIPILINVLKEHLKKSPSISRVMFVKLVEKMTVHEQLFKQLEKKLVEDSRVDMLLGYLEGLRDELRGSVWGYDDETKQDDEDNRDRQIPIKALIREEPKPNQPNIYTLKPNPKMQINYTVLQKDPIDIHQLSQRVAELEHQKDEMIKNLKFAERKNKFNFEEIQRLKAEIQEYKRVVSRNQEINTRGALTDRDKRQQIPKIRLKPRSVAVQTDEGGLDQSSNSLTNNDVLGLSSSRQMIPPGIRLKNKTIVKVENNMPSQPNTSLQHPQYEQPLKQAQQSFSDLINPPTNPQDDLTLDIRILHQHSKFQRRILTLTPSSLLLSDCNSKHLVTYPLTSIKCIQLPSCFTQWLIINFTDSSSDLFIDSPNRMSILTKLLHYNIITPKCIFKVSDIRKLSNHSFQGFINKMLKKPMMSLMIALFRDPDMYGFEVELEKQMDGPATINSYYGVVMKSVILMFATAEYGNVRFVLPILESMRVEEQQEGVVITYCEFMKDVKFRMGVNARTKGILMKLLNQAIKRARIEHERVLTQQNSVLEQAQLLKLLK